MYSYCTRSNAQHDIQPDPCAHVLLQPSTRRQQCHRTFDLSLCQVHSSKFGVVTPHQTTISSPSPAKKPPPQLTSKFEQALLCSTRRSGRRSCLRANLGGGHNQVHAHSQQHQHKASPAQHRTAWQGTHVATAYNFHHVAWVFSIKRCACANRGLHADSVSVQECGVKAHIMCTLLLISTTSALLQRWLSLSVPGVCH